MMKHRKIKLGVVLSALIIVAIILTTSIFDVKAVQNTKPTKCKAGAMQNYYNITYNWSSDMTSLVFKAKHGEFRIAYVQDPSMFSTSLVQGSDGFYTVNGGKGVLKKGQNLTLKLSPKSNANTVYIKLAVSKSDGICDSLTDYNAKKAQNKKTATYDTGNIEIEVPIYGAKDIQVEEANPNYDGICLALRNGTDPTGKIDKKILKLYDGSGDAQAHYKTLVPGCYKKTAVYVYGADDMVPMIQAALNSWDLLKTANVGQGDKDINGDSWLFEFSDVVDAAKREYHSYYTDNLGNFYDTKGGKVIKSKTDSFSMRCNFLAKSATDASNLAEYTSDGKYNIKANSKHYYAYNEVIKDATYKWNYTAGNSLKDKDKEETVNVCTRTCEEAVEINYGPPVASKAGLCFEYQVQVTSRVKCTSKINAKPPTEPKICTPIPHCNNIQGYTHQAGGNEKYNECIRTCDGGKYSKKCSDKCYKKVYKNSNTGVTKTNSSTDTAEVEKISGGMWSGKYKWSSSGSVYWSGSGYARYYRDFEYGRTVRDHGKYLPVNGFKKHYFGNGHYCGDHCYYYGCSQKKYLNKDEARADYKENIKKYEQAIKECKASASCTTKTATFTISVDYKNGKGEIKTIDYPYTDKKETLESSDNKDVCSNNPSVKGKENIILAYKGCYEKCGSGTQYHSHWSFPGSWLNKKTGELSYQPVDKEGWTERDKKFCLPLSITDVNTKWWNYYYGIYNKSHVNSFTNANTSASTRCVSPSKTTTISEDDIEDWIVNDRPRWNINASTKNFGYFGWNFNIGCFYATNTSSIKVVSGSKEDIEKCNTNPKTTTDGAKTQSYRIRTVDLKNLFPASEGTGSREPGFNWSDNANISKGVAEKAKNPSKPGKYAEAVQALGTRVYNDDNLEYRFELTKDSIAQLRKAEKNYTDFKGTMLTQNGMYSYKSDVIRKTNFGSKTVILNESAIGCNNTKGNVCDTSIHDKEAE